MNKERRKELKTAAIRLEIIKDEIERIKGDEEYYYDNIPENLQNSLRADESEEIIDELEELLDSLSDIIDNLNNF